jgi:hypothetical protein
MLEVLQRMKGFGRNFLYHMTLKQALDTSNLVLSRLYSPQESTVPSRKAVGIPCGSTEGIQRSSTAGKT